MAHRFLKEAFQCSCHEDCVEDLAKSFIERIKMTQDNIMFLDLDYYAVWHLFERETNIQEIFKCNPPGFGMMMSMQLLKKQLFKQLYPNATHEGSAAEHTLDHMNEIIDHGD
jgi:hypothetical protein